MGAAIAVIPAFVLAGLAWRGDAVTLAAVERARPACPAPVGRAGPVWTHAVPAPSRAGPPRALSGPAVGPPPGQADDPEAGGAAPGGTGGPLPAPPTPRLTPPPVLPRSVSSLSLLPAFPLPVTSRCAPPRCPRPQLPDRVYSRPSLPAEPTQHVTSRRRSPRRPVRWTEEHHPSCACVQLWAWYLGVYSSVFCFGRREKARTFHQLCE
ncbi:uncharacterized protein [Delphinus delphis]|uniref:uncharacterized protein n=1 Tax=Delphinus delphis TaxID=9728 RepID=UPI003752AFE8